MSYVELRPNDVRPVRVLANGEWWEGFLEAFDRRQDGTWRGCVRWFEARAVTRIGWVGPDDLRLLPWRPR